MPATVSHNRIAPRIATPNAPPLPSDPASRERVLADAVFAAILALQAQLSHPDPAVVMKAAATILDFEKTRLRHGREVVGTAECTPHPEGAVVFEPHPEGAEYTPAAPGGRGEEMDDLDADPSEEMVEQIRSHLQAAQAEYGECKILTPDKAAEVARHFRSHRRPPAALVHGPPARP